MTTLAGRPNAALLIIDAQSDVLARLAGNRAHLPLLGLPVRRRPHRAHRADARGQLCAVP